MILEVGDAPLDVLDLPGADPAVVLLHEGLGSIGLWRGLPETLHAATGRRVVAYSRHGHGRSATRPGPRRALDFFDVEAHTILPALLDALAITAPALIGHSDGATIAAVHATRHPVDRLGLMAPHVCVEPGATAPVAALREQYRHGGLKERMARHHDDPDATFAGWSGLWLDPAFAAWSIDPELDAPLLLIQGVADEYASLLHLDRLERGARGPVTRLEVPGGHSPHLDVAADQVRAALVDFIRGPETDRARGA